MFLSAPSNASDSSILGGLLTSASKVDDIRDFQIEGMSVGDSLLDYFSEDEIVKEEKFYDPLLDNAYYRISFKITDKSEYDFIAAYIKDHDSNYVISSLEGLKYLEYDSCKIQQKIIVKEFVKIFEDNQFWIDSYEREHGFAYYDKDQESRITAVDFYFDDRIASRIVCTNFGNAMEKEGFHDNLTINFISDEYYDYRKRIQANL